MYFVRIFTVQHRDNERVNLVYKFLLFYVYLKENIVSSWVSELCHSK